MQGLGYLSLKISQNSLTIFRKFETIGLKGKKYVNEVFTKIKNIGELVSFLKNIGFTLEKIYTVFEKILEALSSIPELMIVFYNVTEHMYTNTKNFSYLKIREFFYKVIETILVTKYTCGRVYIALNKGKKYTLKDMVNMVKDIGIDLDFLLKI